MSIHNFIPRCYLLRATVIVLFCSRLRIGFSPNSSELGKCTTIEASVPLQPGTLPDDHPSFYTYPRDHEKFDKYVEQLESDGLVKKELARGVARLPSS